MTYMGGKTYTNVSLFEKTLNLQSEKYRSAKN